jgi:dTDP-4-amino-4,6-dideoxygalactose transaminase
MIPVTRTYFPGIEKYQTQIARVWESGWLTNRGQLCKELESGIQNKLMSPPLVLMNNGTIPLQIALKLLGNGGEIITTPFSYVATVSSIVWEGCTPVFVDIHPETLTINPDLIEAAIGPKTTCILATHVFGNICHVEQIENIAKKHNLKVIYDAAHCFGVRYNNKSIFEFGDIATCSFHATKIFHCGEGGALFSRDEDLLLRAFRMHNFGHVTPESFEEVGINGKISELNAAMGICVLDDMNEILSARMNVVDFYRKNLSFKGFRTQHLQDGLDWNASYFPIWFDTKSQMEAVLSKLQEASIFPRRYFYPSLNQLPYVNGESCPVSEDISEKILCLPLYVGLSADDLNLISEIINSNA